jgi:hypothetical protein
MMTQSPSTGHRGQLNHRHRRRCFTQWPGLAPCCLFDAVGRPGFGLLSGGPPPETVVEDPVPRAALCCRRVRVPEPRIIKEGVTSKNWDLSVRCDDKLVPCQQMTKVGPL